MFQDRISPKWTFPGTPGTCRQHHPPAGCVDGGPFFPGSLKRLFISHYTSSCAGYAVAAGPVLSWFDPMFSRAGFP